MTSCGMTRPVRRFEVGRAPSALVVSQPTMAAAVESHHAHREDPDHTSGPGRSAHRSLHPLRPARVHGVGEALPPVYLTLSVCHE